MADCKAFQGAKCPETQNLHEHKNNCEIAEKVVEVSVIIPVHNAEKWLSECLKSIETQTFSGTIEVSIYNDSSTDCSMDLVSEWSKKINKETRVVTGGHNDPVPRGVGYAKNRAVEQSTGKYLCFLDADDVMLDNRIQVQHKAAVQHTDAIVGGQFVREPEGSTLRFTKWANQLTHQQLYTQIYTSHGPTLVMPTWFCARQVYDRIGGFDESGKGTPEDLIFFLKHLKTGGRLHKVDIPVLIYRFHSGATTFSIHEETIWNIRVKAIQEDVIDKWSEFTIWNAGKQGRKLYRSLSDNNRQKVLAFCDVDDKKLNKGYYTFEESRTIPKLQVPIVHFSVAKPPFIICVKQDLTGGCFEQNLKSLNLEEGVDYFHFN